jgi:hypothetical protein
VTDAYRDAYGLVLAWLDEDDERAAEMLAPYLLGADELGLVVSLLSLVAIDRDPDVLRELLAKVALVGAGRPS